MDDPCMKLSFRGLLERLLKEHLCPLDKTKILLHKSQDSTVSQGPGEKETPLKEVQSLRWSVTVSEKSILGHELLP